MLGFGLPPPPHFIFRGIGSEPACVFWGKSPSAYFGATSAMASARLVLNQVPVLLISARPCTP